MRSWGGMWGCGAVVGDVGAMGWDVGLWGRMWGCGAGPADSSLFVAAHGTRVWHRGSVNKEKAVFITASCVAAGGWEGGEGGVENNAAGWHWVGMEGLRWDGGERERRGPELGMLWGWRGPELGMLWGWRGPELGLLWGWRGPELGLLWGWRGPELGMLWGWRGPELGMLWGWSCRCRAQGVTSG